MLRIWNLAKNVGSLTNQLTRSVAVRLQDAPQAVIIEPRISKKSNAALLMGSETGLAKRSADETASQASPR